MELLGAGRLSGRLDLRRHAGWHHRRQPVHAARRHRCDQRASTWATATLAASIGYEYEQGDQLTIVSAPVIQNGFQNVVAGRAFLGGGVPFAVSSAGTSVTLAPLQSVTTTQLQQLGQSQQSRRAGHLHARRSTPGRRPSPRGRSASCRGRRSLATVSLAAAAAASFTTTSLPVGSAAITAVYNGAAGILGSTSPTLHVGGPHSTVTSLAGSPNPSLSGQPVTFTATVTAGGAPVMAGTVTFRRGSQLLGTVPLDGGRHGEPVGFLVPGGNDRIQAVYNGTVDDRTSVSPVFKQTRQSVATATS